MKKLITLIALLAIAGTASAQIVAGDELLFGSEATGAAGGITTHVLDGNTWNNVDFADMTTGTVLLKDGTDESVSLTRTAYPTATGVLVKDNGGPAIGAGLDWLTASVPSLDWGYSAITDATMAYSIAGLNAGLNYDVYWTANGNSNTRYIDMDVTLNSEAVQNFDAFAAGAGTGPLELQWKNVALEGGLLSFDIAAVNGTRLSTGFFRVVAVSGGPAPVVGTLFVIK